MSFVSFSLVVIFIIRLFNISAFRVPKLIDIVVDNAKAFGYLHHKWQAHIVVYYARNSFLTEAEYW